MNFGSNFTFEDTEQKKVTQHIKSFTSIKYSVCSTRGEKIALERFVDKLISKLTLHCYMLLL